MMPRDSILSDFTDKWPGGSVPDQVRGGSLEIQAESSAIKKL